MRTYSTPSMILDIEETCRDLVIEHTDDGEDSVGTEVMVRHLAPTPLGMKVTITVKSIVGERTQGFSSKPRSATSWRWSAAGLTNAL